MKENKNIILAGLCAFLLLLGLITNNTFGWFTESYADAKPVIANFNPDNITELHLKEAGDTILSLYQANSWMVSYKGSQKYRGDKENILKNLTLLKKMKRFHEVASSKKYFEQYKVQDNNFSIEIKDNQNKVQKVFLGAGGKSFNSTLVRLGDSDTIYSVAGNLKASFNKELDFYRDKALLNFAETNVASIKVSGPQNFMLTKGQTGGWELSIKGKNYPAKIDQVQSILKKMKSLKGDRFFKDKGLTKYGQLEILFNSGVEPLVMPIMKKAKTNKLYAQTAYSINTVELDQYKINEIFKNPETLKNVGAKTTGGNDGIPDLTGGGKK